MYKIERKVYGFRITLSGYIEEKEALRWVADSRKEIEKSTGPFCVFVDMRNIDPLPSATRKLFMHGQMLYRNAGMIRSVVIVSDSSTYLHFKRIAMESGIYGKERYIKASGNPDWEIEGLNWLRYGTEPDSGEISTMAEVTPGRRRGN